MLKFFFWLLVVANLGLFAYHQGYLGSWTGENREPARLSRQQNADKVRLLPASAPLSGAVTPASERIESALEPLACLEFDGMPEAEAQKFEAQLASLALGQRLSKRTVQEPGSYLVLMPTQGSKELADKKAGELRRLGVSDFAVIQDNTELRWAISLGIFSTEDAAKNRLAAVAKQGVRSARIMPRNTVAKLVFQVNGLDAATRDKLERVRINFPQAQVRACPTLSL